MIKMEFSILNILRLNPDDSGSYFSNIAFDCSESNSIPVEEFLTSCDEFILYFDTFDSSIFSTVTKDFNGNINKLRGN